MMKIIRQFFSFLKKWFWTKPTDKPDPIKATQVLHNYTCIKYKGQWVNLKIEEVAMFNALARSDKRAMARRFEVLQGKGKIAFKKIDGKMICLKNKDYEQRAEDAR